ncbi:hypothetical protein [sulfur-oxidizing endosymbiont of Gigantopelta aegis]|uniref:hypothetical protein n=1 Tax=sulfur-oxidizing endosymbiont of Gigantopelta aegis TaxID=2794934 RepID=UPI0018DD7CC2|nr:hypothetical protein [sulfur-oxidizing endosymbiont of Gigantopelta aegis]
MNFSERVNKPELSENYYDFDGTIETFPEIAKKINNGTFFETNLSAYYLLRKLDIDYARYREYPRP